MPRKTRQQSRTQMIERLSDPVPPGPLHAVRVQAKLIDHAHNEFRQAVEFIGDDEQTEAGTTYRINAIHAQACKLNAMVNMMFDELTKARSV